MLLPDDTDYNDKDHDTDDDDTDYNDNDTDDNVLDNYYESYESLPLSEGGGGCGAEWDRGGNTRPALPGILLLEIRKLLMVRTF